MVAFAAYAPAIIARGICSGIGPLPLLRHRDGQPTAWCGSSCASSSPSSASRRAGAYGFAVALAPLVGLGSCGRAARCAPTDGPEAPWSEVTPNLGWLLLGSVFAAMLLNAGPIATTILAEPDQKTEVTAFAYGVLMARIPLFLFQAVQAALLPRLSRLAARSELGEFRAGLKRLLMVVLAVGVVGTIGALVLGPFVIKTFYNADLTGRTLAMLALGSALLHGRHLAGPGRSSPSRATPTWRSAGASASSCSCSPRGCRATTCSSGSRSGCWRRRSRRWPRSPSCCATAWPRASSPTPTR